MVSKTDLKGITRGFDHGESGVAVANAMNNNYRVMSVLLQGSVKSTVIEIAPTSNLDGDAYIIPATATGTWINHKGDIAQWDASLGAWFYLKVKKGFSIYVEDVDQQWVNTNTGWKVVQFTT